MINNQFLHSLSHTDKLFVILFEYNTSSSKVTFFFLLNQMHYMTKTSND